MRCQAAVCHRGKEEEEEEEEEEVVGCLRSKSPQSLEVQPGHQGRKRRGCLLAALAAVLEGE